MTITHLAPNQLYGLASDTKPTTIPTNSTFYETDTGKNYRYDGTSWKPYWKSEPGDAVVFKDGTKFYAQEPDGSIISENTDAYTVIQAGINSGLVNGGLLKIAENTYTLENPILIPTSTTSYAYSIEGVYNNSRTSSDGVLFQAGTTFTDGRYLIETDSATVGSLNRVALHIKNIHFYNPYFNTGGTAPTKNVGGIKMENDSNVVGMHAAVSDCIFQYCWRPLHLIGWMYAGHFDNLYFYDGNSAGLFVGDFDIKLEAGGHSDKPKMCNFYNIKTTHLAGVGGATGSMANAIYIEGGYNKFYGVNIDGWTYTDSVIKFFKAFSNEFFGLMIIDLNQAPTPDNRLGTVVFDGGSGSETTFGNRIFGAEWGPYSLLNYSIAYRNNAARNYVQLGSFVSAGAGGLTIDDSGAHTTRKNIVELIPGQLALATADAKATTTNGNVVIIDKRNGASRRGATASVTDGGTITHGCMTTPAVVTVVGSVANEIVAVTAVGATTFTVAIKKRADGTAGTTQTIYWNAEVYT